MNSILKTNKESHRLGMVVHVFDHPSLGRQGQADLCELEDSLIYVVSSKSRETVSSNKQTKQLREIMWIHH